jgi:hypothetical protein
MRDTVVMVGFALFLWGLYRLAGWRRAARRGPVVCACGERIIIGPPVHADNMVHDFKVCHPAAREVL